jgi:Ca2+-binding RTX toxin-like protein
VSGRRALARLITITVAVLAVAPASANAAGGLVATIGADGTLQITGDSQVDHVALVTVTPPGSSTPDLVTGDVTAGIASIPPSCFMVDPTIFRCLQSSITGININLGGGNDTLSAKEIQEINLRVARFNAELGKGNDVAVGGPFPNVILGGPGRDMIMGGPFDDRLLGGPQNDFSVGLGGNDFFNCGKGPNDLFNDGPGKDLVNVRTCEQRVHRQFVP